MVFTAERLAQLTISSGLEDYRSFGYAASGGMAMISKLSIGSLVLCLILLSAQSIAMSLSDTLLQRELQGLRQDKWCQEQGGQARAVAADGTRIDCLTPTQAIKVGVASDWEGALGTALFYGLHTGRKPGVALLLENAEDQKYWLDLNATVQHFGLPVATWKIEASRSQ